MSEKHSFWNEIKGYLWIAPVYVAVTVAVTVLYDLNREYCFYVNGFFLVMFVAAVVIAYLQFLRREREIQNNPKPDEDARKRWEKYQENEDFFALWTHQIKTPIAALNVLLQEPQVEPIACRQELIKIEGYVDMALGYTRYENMSNDLVLEPHNLEEIVKNVVKKYATIFIYKHISVQLDNLDHPILTDEKWFAFVLEQILSNALKYTSQGTVTIAAKEEAQGLKVSVSDTGIGIRAEDLPRVFEKGFTGYNGRMDKKASGLGLYLCKGICGKLGHLIRIDSKINEGTTVEILVQTERVKRGDLTKM